MLKFASIPAFYAACGIRGVTVTTLEHLWNEVGQDLTRFNQLLINPARLFESTFPTGGRLGTRANEISASFRERKALLDQHVLWIQVEEKVEVTQSGSLKFAVAGKSFCCTGAGPEPRNVLQARIKANGGIIHESVSSKTNYLIMADKNSVTSKAKKAQVAGTVLLSYGDVF